MRGCIEGSKSRNNLQRTYLHIKKQGVYYESQIKWRTAHLFTGFEAWTKVWLMFLQAKQTKKMYKLWFLRLKANKKGTSDVFTDSTALRKVSL